MTEFVSDTKKQGSISRQGWAVLVGLTVAQLLSAAGQMTVVTLAGSATRRSAVHSAANSDPTSARCTQLDRSNSVSLVDL